MISFDLHKISLPKGLFITIVVYSVLITPLWYLFQFHRDIYNNTDLLKLIPLALAIGIPPTAISAYVALLFSEARYLPDNADTVNDLIYNKISLGAFDASFCFFVPCILIPFLPMTPMIAAYTVAGLLVLNVIINILLKRKHLKEYRRKYGIEDTPEVSD